MTVKVPGASPTAVDAGGYALRADPAGLIRGRLDGFPLVTHAADRVSLDCRSAGPESLCIPYGACGLVAGS